MVFLSSDLTMVWLPNLISALRILRSFLPFVLRSSANHCPLPVGLIGAVSVDVPDFLMSLLVHLPTGRRLAPRAMLDILPVWVIVRKRSLGRREIGNFSPL